MNKSKMLTEGNYGVYKIQYNSRTNEGIAIEFKHDLDMSFSSVRKDICIYTYIFVYICIFVYIYRRIYIRRSSECNLFSILLVTHNHIPLVGINMNKNCTI